MENQATLPEEKPKKIKWLYLILALMSLIYIFFPEFTDGIPILGWIDEGVALFLFTYALRKLGVNMPWIEKILSLIKRKKR
ncbi:MAG: hypothetical protein NZ853_06250 [Leptospiraceae bacterium]|nr:hypothetical protein [Leptospiraceae bacterium]MDW7976447.1 hypothetical protein [Leptospiraceae bacterium]